MALIDRALKQSSAKHSFGDEAVCPKVLYLTKVYPYPPATAGDAVYTRGIIESLAGLCRLSVVCADSGGARPTGSDIDWHFVGPQKETQVGSVLSALPLVSWRGATSQYARKLRALLMQRWDAIVLDNLGLAHALPQAENYRTAYPSTRLIYVSHEYEYPTRSAKYAAYRLGLFKRLVAGRDLKKVRYWEGAMLRSADVVTLINASDLPPFREIAPGRKYLPLPPGYNGPVADIRRVTAATPRRALLLGGRRSEQKRQILLDWLDLSYRRLTAAGIELVVAGDMEDSLRDRLARDYPQVQVMGFVDDLEGLLATARMGIIADTVGGGFKLRLLSHVFQRLPIIGLGDAIDGLPTREGDGYLGAPDLPALVSLVEGVIDDVERLDRLQRRAFDDCAEAYSWESRARSFAKILQGLDDELVS